jgi:uncharacterized protein YkwD
MLFKYRVPGVAGDNTADYWANAIWAEHNRERRALGIPPLTRSPLLDQVAAIRDDDLVNEGYFSHNDPNNNPGNYQSVAVQQGLAVWGWLGENLAMNNYKNPLAEAWRGLMASPTHRDNILTRDFTHLGVAARIRPDGLYVFVLIYASSDQL